MTKQAKKGKVQVSTFLFHIRTSYTAMTEFG